MKNQFVCLDLFCGGGGAAQGLIEAGFTVIGIDIKDRSKNYPGHFFKKDLRDRTGWAEFNKFSFSITKRHNYRPYDFIWASPPCQKFSVARRGKFKEAVNLIPLTKRIINDMIINSQVPFYCIENVRRAPIRKDLTLMGGMFGLNRIIRERVFEKNFLHDVSQPIVKGFHCERHEILIVTKCMGSKSMHRARKAAGLKPRPYKEEVLKAMGIKHNMTWEELGESVPPAYAKHIGDTVMFYLKNERTLIRNL